MVGGICRQAYDGSRWEGGASRNLWKHNIQSIGMQHKERFGKGIYRNFAAEMEKFRKGKDSHILCEFENAWKFGSLFSVWDAEGCVCVADDLGRMRIEYPKGEGKTYTIQFYDRNVWRGSTSFPVEEDRLQKWKGTTNKGLLVAGV